MRAMHGEYEHININTDYITLGQLIKLANIFESGGTIKSFLKEEGVLVNGSKEHRRGRKLYEDDVVEVKQAGTYIVKIDE